MGSAGPYPAAAFLAENPGDSHSCALTLGGNALLIETADGLRREWKYRGLKFAAAGADGDFLLITSLEEKAPISGVTVRHSGFYRALAERIGGLDRDFVAGFEKAIGGRKRKKWTALILAAGLAAGVAVGGYWFISSWVASYAARNLPVEAEISWGQAILKTQLAGKNVVKGGPAFEAAQAIMGRLKAALPEPAPYPLSLNVIEDDAVNAFALPGGNMVLMTGLMREARSPEEVAGVLAHEIQHVLKRHVVKRLVQSLGWRVWVSVLVGGSDLAELAFGAGSLLELSYGRAQETEADLEGARLLAAAELPVRPLADFFERLDEKSDTEALPAFLSTHPLSQKRALRLRELAAELDSGRIRKLRAIDWRRVQRSL